MSQSNPSRSRALGAFWIGLICAAVSAFAPPANASNLTIIPTFDSSITSDPNHVAIENAIDQAVSFYDSYYTNPITVPIYFQEVDSGLGESEWEYYTEPYQTVYNALKTDATNSRNSILSGALAYQPNQTDNPVTGTANIYIKSANLRAIGLGGSPPLNVGGGFYDGQISLNVSETTVGGGEYSLIAVAEHEMDEVLGLGSSLNFGSPTDPLPEDLYRYAQGPTSTRNFTTSGDDAYFSIDGGATDLVQFNQDSGGDYGDWWSHNGGGNPGPTPPPRVQDAYAYPGTTPTLGVELTALDVIGYDPAPVPEPASFGLLAVGAICFLGLFGRRRTAAI